MDETYTVYKHTTPSNKVYIGITSKDVKIRWNKGLGYKNNTHFWNAICKYGWTNIQHDIVAENLTKSEACELEIKLIAEYDSTNPDKGYNHSAGGECKTNGVIVSKDTRKKISERLTGRTLSNITKQKLREANIGKRGNRVQCIETGKIYRNAQEAHRDTGIYFKSIQRAASGQYQTAGKLHWRFIDLTEKSVGCA